MILKITSAKPNPLWSASLDLDYTTKRWELVGSPTAEWRRITNDTRGTFQIVCGGANIWIWDSKSGRAKQNPLILWDTPTSGNDKLHTDGGGLMFAPVQKSLKDVKINWTLGGTASASPGKKGKSIRDDAVKLIKDNIGDRPGILIETPNWVEKTKRVRDPEKNDQGFSKTGCGGLPGKLFTELTTMGWPIPTDRVDSTSPFYTGKPRTAEDLKKTDEEKMMQLAGVAFGYKFIAQQIEKRRGKPGSIYIDFSKRGKRNPLPGDIYVIAIPKTGIIRHVGVVLQCDGHRLLAADGGQGGPLGSGYALAINEKFYDAKSYLTGKGETGILDGWLDLEAVIRE